MLDYALILLASLLAATGIVSTTNINKKGIYLTSSIILITIIIASLFFFLTTATSYLFNNLFYINPASTLFCLLVSTSLFLINTLAYSHSTDYKPFFMLFSFAASGMFLVVLASSLISIILGIELMTISTAFLILLEKKSNIESAMKLFLMSILSIATFTFGIAMLLPFSPNLLLNAFSLNSAFGSGVAILGVILVISAIALEASLFPFNLWVPDVYEGAASHITAMLAGVNKKVAFIALIYIIFIFLTPFLAQISLMMALLATLTMFFGNLVAMMQKNVKRMFAYSSISQAGYIAVGIAAASQYGIAASIFQIFAHSFMIIGAFAIILWLESKNIKAVEDYEGLAGRNKLASASLSIFMLSMIGIPFTAGFVGKFLLFSSAIFSGMLWLALLAILNSALSIYYYMKVIFSMYMKKDKRPLYLNKYISAVVLASIIFIIIFGIYPEPLINASLIASSYIL
ncbi:MAG: NADH-quinone oxidoreductase subunit N [Candidatus Micrarchaeia archaeon]